MDVPALMVRQDPGHAREQALHDREPGYYLHIQRGLAACGRNVEQQRSHHDAAADAEKSGKHAATEPERGNQDQERDRHVRVHFVR